ncbi:hypothetical protein E3J62_11395 [candidate division TA06 bacterium]|uniref:Uncharacterized protein n=1 Tax=candidate division TA06 bacterium TaxID=2250710 RepID=A0A523UNL5_UNCT6|nr:MAG: hypothetical protein E3J62_11395 [candidate division TA06 bacterium]
MKLEEGARVYYDGDMANPPGLGVIVRICEDAGWGISVDIRLDDGREFNVPRSAFSPEYKGDGGTRFVTEEAYSAWREARIVEFRKRTKKQNPKRLTVIHHAGSHFTEPGNRGR